MTGAALSISETFGADDWPLSTAGQLVLVDVNAPRRVYLDNDGEVFCLVSPGRYGWVTQWRWSWRWDRTKTKRYATRTSWRDGRRCTIYMHKAILGETGKVRPTEAHTIGDHQDGDSLNNQDDNLEWATVSQNRRNRKR
ncbi:hypothetical protein [Bradyrhizobium sp. USDA 4452]